MYHQLEASWRLSLHFFRKKVPYEKFIELLKAGDRVGEWLEPCPGYSFQRDQEHSAFHNIYRPIQIQSSLEVGYVVLWIGCPIIFLL